MVAARIQSSRKKRVAVNFIESRIQEFTNNSEIENSRNKSHKKISEFTVQVNLIITLSLGSMKTDCVISEPCYNEVIYNRYIAK